MHYSIRLMATILTMMIFIMISNQADAQRYFTKSGTITFISDTPVEKIEAVNERSAIVADFGSGEVQAAALIRSFHFERALMEEHFNENYLESDKYPKAVFQGKIDDLSSIDLGTEGTVDVHASGALTLHGVTQEVTVPASITVQKGTDGMTVTVDATFVVKPEDYDIKIPSIVVDQIAKEINVEVDATLQLAN